MMKYLRIFARLLALAVLVIWCVASAGAAQAPTQQTAKAPESQPTKRVVPGKNLHSRSRQAARAARSKRASASAPKLSTVSKATPAPSAVPSVSSAAVHPTEIPELTHGRDPFAALIRATDPNAGHTNLPPGIGGLQVATVRLEGMVKTAEGMVAVVANPEDRVYFLHDGDHIYDGVVEKIGLDDITFRQESKDAFGRTVDRDVSKRLYPIAGDAQ